MTDEQKQKIIALSRDGAGYGQIAAAVGISINTVKSFCRRHSLAAKTATAVGIGLIKNSVPIFL
ncbi:helix-turn-helix domain-containing protein [uncultured Megasphaera sp.]|uniref:helix-turn-helix domain-containing protein n=1 Tax=uncultured Megasphaera sp. TaxID=165188 RepID=UPI002671A82E|nr:helix-turn-helix domain-containing protein [uncultured Megasphaera sp.]